MKKSTENSGIATIIALGITALILSLLIAYVTTSIIERKATENYQNVVSARMAANSALNRALAQMKSTDMKASLNNTVSSDTTRILTTDEVDSLKAIIPTKIEGTSYYADTQINSIYANGTDTTSIKWIYFTAGGGDKGYLSRIAYAIISDTMGKLDISALIDSGKNAANFSVTPPSEGNTGIAINYMSGSATNKEITGISSLGTYIQGRPGVNTSEMFLRSLATNSSTKSWFTDLFAQKLSVTTSGANGKLSVGKKWTDFPTLFNALGITEGSSTANNFKNIFTLNEPYTAEAYWIDANSDTIKDTTELYHRFNLARTDWDSLNVSDFTNATQYTANTTVPGESTNYLPWLINWKYAGDMGNSIAARNQMIANLIDYNDYNDTGTTDSTVNPTYWGNERVPYLNEIRIPVQVSLVKNGSGNKAWSYNITVGPLNLEYVNIYSGISIPAFKISVENLDASFKTQYNSSSEILTITDTSLTTASLTDVSIGYKTANTTTGTSIYGTTAHTYNSSYLSCSISFNSLKIAIKDSSLQNYYDFSSIGNGASISLGNIFSETPVTYYIDYQIRDPRQNLLSTDWGTALAASSVNGTIGSRNSNFPTSNSYFDNANIDREDNLAYTSYDPWNISTAYIRNAPMQSPWELGLIHRAKDFQTLNLKKYNISEGYSNGAGGNAYSDGDANILDQIKMSKDVLVFGKVNINTSIDPVLRILFEKIRKGSAVDTPGSLVGANELTNTDAGYIAAKILAKNGTNGGSIFATRASILSDLEISYQLVNGMSPGNPGQYITDKNMEEVIGKYINLSETSSGNAFYVIAVAQSLKDLYPFQQFGSFDHVLATVKILAIINRDPITNEFIVTRLIYTTN